MVKVILLKAVKGLGQRDEIFTVSAGYARNFLVSRGFAKIADQEAEEAVQRKKDQSQKKSELEGQAADVLASKLRGSVFGFETRADERGHLYAGLKESEILAKIKESVPALRGRAGLVDYYAIKQTGEHAVTLKLGKNQIEVTIHVKKA